MFPDMQAEELFLSPAATEQLFEDFQYEIIREMKDRRRELKLNTFVLQEPLVKNAKVGILIRPTVHFCIKL
jgi:hypothetical protein